MKDCRKNGDKVKLVRDILYINGKPYIPEDEDEASGSTTPDRRTPNKFQGVSKKDGGLALHQIHDRDSRGSVLRTYLSVRGNTLT